ncbi:ATP-binding protein [bacterium]|nr:ATP-binding protein [bacterium]
MIISVASGKGGTGKTTVATNLAYSLNTNVQILDCDVEEPNAHLFLKPKMENSIPVLATVPAVDKEKCTLCRKCVEICRFNAITIVGETILTFPQLCHDCGGCIEICPENAVMKSSREIGIVEKGTKNGMEFIHGLLRIGEAMSPPLIRQVRKNSSKDKITIIDAPPGTSCPVIAAMKDTDFVLMVTEPTPFGLHDLILAVEAVNELGIPKGLVINRSDVGDNGVKDYARQNNIPILMEIPFDRTIAELYSRGELLAEHSPDWKNAFLSLYQKIDDLITH